MLLRGVKLGVLFTLLNTVLTQDCPSPSELPPLPSYFTSTLQYNIRSTERLSHSIPVHNIPGLEAAGGPPKGISVSIDEAYDDIQRAGFVRSYSEQNFVKEGTDEPVFTMEKVIHNEHLSGFEGFLTHTKSNEGHIEYCVADSVIEDGGIAAIFGVFCQGKDPKTCMKFSVTDMLHGEFCWKFNQSMIIRGVNVKEYVATIMDNESGKLEMSYYWSDLDNWVSSGGAGTSVPIAARLWGSVGVTDIQIEMDYQNFFVIQLPEQEYNAPRMMYCKGRKADLPLPNLFPKHFTFGSELVFIHDLDEEHIHKFITARTEWYDNDFNISRIDYKPYDKNHPTSPYASDAHNVREIMDFNVGMKFVIDEMLGNCSISKITYDPYSPDGNVDVDDNGHIIMVSPIHHFHMEGKFSYNGQIYDRGILMDEWSTSISIDQEGGTKNLTTLVYFAAANYASVDERFGFIPLKTVTYPQNALQIKWNEMQTYNIFGFTDNEALVQEFDISYCYKDDEKMRLSITFPMVSEMNIVGMEAILLREVKLMTLVWGNVALIRIQNLEYFVYEGEGKFDIMFTVVAPPPLPEGNEIPQEYLTLNKDIKASLQQAVDGNNFTLFEISPNNEFVTITAVSGSLLEIDVDGGGPGDLNDNNFNVNYKKGYSSGAMAGLAFGMIFLGMLVGGVIYFLSFRNNVRAGLPASRSFENPLAGLTGLGK